MQFDRRTTAARPPSRARPSLRARRRPAFAQSAAQPFRPMGRASAPRRAPRELPTRPTTRVMGGLKPDKTVFTEIRSQPEFNQQLWQYINRRVSDWRIQAGQERLKEFARCLRASRRTSASSARVMLGLWGIESTFGDPWCKQNHSRPVFRRSRRSPGASRAGAPIGRPELINALRIVAEGLGNAEGDGRLMGRRHGAHAVDAGGLAQCRPRL